MPRLKAVDSDDESWEDSDAELSELEQVSETDSDDDFQEDITSRVVLGRPHTKIPDGGSNEYVSGAHGMAERSGLGAARLEDEQVRGARVVE